MCAIKILHGLKFNKHTALNNQVSFELAYILASEINRDRNLSFNAKTFAPESKVHAIAIHRLEKTVADLVVNVVIHPDNFVRQFGMQQL